MASRLALQRWWQPALSVVLSLTAAAPAQTRAEQIAKLAEPWLASDQSDRAQLDALVKALLVEPKEGIAWLAAELPKATAAPVEVRSKGVLSLVTHTTLEFMRRQRASGITFVGQYAGLQPLQPVVGDFLFGLLLETPEWYPDTHRVHLVPALRDLQPRLPAAARLDGVTRIAENAALEPDNLRRGLAALLWQWDKKQPAQAIIAALVAATGEGEAEERVQTTLELADFYNQLREYKQAAGAHRAAQTLAKSGKVTLKPIAWYSAACVHCLAGDVDRALAALEQCVEQLASPHLDSSLRLPRTMFDTDPELGPLRAHARWNELMQRAFPPTTDAGR